MEYKRFGQKIILRLNPGEEVTECIREVCRTEKVALGEVSGEENYQTQEAYVKKIELRNESSCERSIMESPSRESMKLPPLQATLHSREKTPIFICTW